MLQTAIRITIRNDMSSLNKLLSSKPSTTYFNILFWESKVQEMSISSCCGPKSSVEICQQLSELSSNRWSHARSHTASNVAAVCLWQSEILWVRNVYHSCCTTAINISLRYHSCLLSLDRWLSMCTSVQISNITKVSVQNVLECKLEDVGATVWSLNRWTPGGNVPTLRSGVISASQHHASGCDASPTSGSLYMVQVRSVGGPQSWSDEVWCFRS